MFDFSTVASWLDEFLRGFMPSWLAITTECVLVAVFLLAAYSIIAMIYIMYERWVCGWIQCRRGPIRVGPGGSLQIFADVVKIPEPQLQSVDLNQLVGSCRSFMESVCVNRNINISMNLCDIITDNLKRHRHLL